MMVILHDYWRSTASYRVRIALEVKGIRYDRSPVNLLTGEQRLPEHLALNPQGLVPVLEIDGKQLTQSLAIIEYLDETHPEPALLSKDPGGRACIRALSLAIASEIHPLANLSVLKRIEDLAGQEARVDWNRDTIIKGLSAIEQMLGHPHFGDFCYGDTPTMADCALIPQLYNATRWDVPFNHLPRISVVAENCAKLAAFTAARPENFKPQ